MIRPDPLDVLRGRPEWGQAVQQLRALISQHGDEARRRAEAYGRFYAGRRGSMVVDVVLSRQRRYQERVLPLVARWESDSEAHSMRWLAGHELAQKRYGLRSGESATIAALACNLVDFVDERSLGEQEDEGCMQWAQGVAGLKHAPGLDPVAGSVTGIGPALFAYLRMRSGADALKPDLRVARALRKLGFYVPVGEHAILVVAHAAADEAAISLLVLDQLLWWLTLSGKPPTTGARNRRSGRMRSPAWPGREWCISGRSAWQQPPCHQLASPVCSQAGSGPSAG